MRIAIVVERFPPDIGGSGTRYYKIAEHLSKKHAIDVFTLGKPSDNYEKCGFNVYRFNSDTRILPSPLNKLNRVTFFSSSVFLKLFSRSYDIIDVDVWPFIPFFAVKAAKPEVPVVVSWNSVWPFAYNKIVSRICEALAYPVSKIGNYHVAVSNFAKKILQEKFKISKEKIRVIPNGIDKEFLEAKLEPQFGRIVYVGRLEPQKRLDLLLAAFKLFKKKVNNAELHIIGFGPLYTRLINESEKTGGIYIHKPVPQKERRQLISYLKNAWVFVSASEFESYGLSIAEALSMGLPAILTNAPYNAATKEIVSHNYNGLIVDHGKPEAICKAFEKLYQNLELWRQLSNNARQSLRFSWSDVAKEVEEVYKILKKTD
ncbi:glycosyltransferase family 4 protein [Candidatus Bathyarchaeota archaeon]|nr:glycosyltransferase family 4 protein [Candidatus Bathyarchaeota archaeon]